MQFEDIPFIKNNFDYYFTGLMINRGLELIKIKELDENDLTRLDVIKKFDYELYEINQSFINNSITKDEYIEKLNEHIEYINKLLNESILISNEKELYFRYCTFIVYEKTFDTRFKELKIKFPDFDIEMFLQQEHEDIIHQRNIYSFLDINNKTNIEISYNKKIEFLAKRALEYGYVIDKSLNPEKIIDDLFKEFENSTINFKLKTAELEEDIDFQFESNLNDKILILDQLGFIDLLKTKNPNISGNKISKLLSSILEEKQASITPLINRLIQPNQEMDNKHPYYSIQSKNRVKEFLKHLGFQFKDKFNSI